MVNLHRIKLHLPPIKKYGGNVIKVMNGRQLSALEVIEAPGALIVPGKRLPKNTIFPLKLNNLNFKF